MEQVLFLITIVSSFVFSGRCSNVYNYSRNDFPEGFVFGSAISAYQWEGAADEDGRTPSVWDTKFHSTSGPEGYHKYKEDVKLINDMGLDAFRLSISWSRLIPGGRGPVNPKGLEFYKSFIAELKRHGIEPHVTLFHDDLPQILQDEYGGWLDRRSIDDFTAFADVCFREFGESVKFWSTINEPNIIALIDYGSLVNCTPPFGVANCSTESSSSAPYIALHNILLAHASASRLYKTKYKDKQNGSIGITFYAFWMIPLTSSEEDKIAAQRNKDVLLGWLLHPLFFGDYADAMKRTVGKLLPSFSQEESNLVKDSSDFVGVIHYQTFYISHSETRDLIIPTGNSTLLELDVFPRGLEEVLEYIKQNYGNPPVYVLENGTPSHHDSSSLNDVGRVEYLGAYIGAVLNAVRNGSDTRGYFQWSFMDLFEVIDANYTYGLYYVNFSDPQRKRTPKTSAFWYSAFLNGTQQELKNLSLSPSPGFASQ
ncbi:unnamed protein product [Microthlaspi erraticum]|uniref:Thioglucosidase n=1 Tax=Microthlaspi erraticum TaxID=1685480 RepID=A0A6D2K193_9BRAS|nr:unnamed protein product [Microthlaspi erraticum]